MVRFASAATTTSATSSVSAFEVTATSTDWASPVVRDRFAMPGATTPIDLNAAFPADGQDAIEITAAIAQPPFFVPGADPAVNYCTIGAVIGHEITHGFDSTGRLFDARGNLRDWWTPGAASAFHGAHGRARQAIGSVRGAARASRTTAR